MAKTLENGSFQDPRGNAVNAGTVEFVLSQDAMLTAGGQVAPTLVSATLTSTGDMPSSFTISANDELTPSGTFYLVTVFDSNGARVFGPERWVLSGASPIDLDTLTPTIVDPAFADPILSNPVAVQAIEDFNLTLPLLNNVRIVDGVKFTTIQSAIDDLPAGGGTVFIPAGTYNISSVIAWTGDNISLVGEGPGRTIIKKTASTHFIDVGSLSARVTSESNTLTSNAAVGDTTLALSSGKGTNFTADTWVVLINDATAEGSGVTNTAAEFVFIESISTDTLNLASPLKFAHTTANNAEVQRINFVDNPSIEGIAFDGDGQTGGTVNDDNGIVLMWCRNAKVINVSGFDLPNFFLGLEGCLNAKIDGLYARDLLSDGIDGATGNFGYAIVELSMNEGLVANNIQVERVRHAYTTAILSLLIGIPIGSRITNGWASQMRGSGWDTHEEGLDISFVNCATVGSVGHGFQFRSARTSCSNCLARDTIGAAVNITSDANMTRFTSLTVRRTNQGTFASVDYTTKDAIEDAGTATIIDGLIRKEADQTVTNSNTLVDDDDFVVAIEKRQRMFFLAGIRYNSGTTPDIKFTFTGPSGSTVVWTPVNGGVWNVSGTWTAQGEASGGTTIAFLSTGGSRWAHLTGWIENGGTEGDLKFRWAQQTADASNTIVQDNSYMMIWPQ